MNIKPRIAITHGDPAGIGPELIAKLLAIPDLTDLADVILVGDRHVFELGQRQAGVDWPMRAIELEHSENWWTGTPYAWFPMETIAPDSATTDSPGASLKSIIAKSGELLISYGMFLSS